MAELVASIDVDAPAETTWAALTDWDRQGEWMLATTTRATRHGGRGVDAGIVAFSGVGRVGLRDPMVITAWDPPRRCVVAHTGRVIRGAGAFDVESLSAHRSRCVWSEWLEVPFGGVGELGFRLVRPMIAAGLAGSLRRFARFAASYR